MERDMDDMVFTLNPVASTKGEWACRHSSPLPCEAVLELAVSTDHRCASPWSLTVATGQRVQEGKCSRDLKRMCLHVLTSVTCFSQNVGKCVSSESNPQYYLFSLGTYVIEGEQEKLKCSRTEFQKAKRVCHSTVIIK